MTVTAHIDFVNGLKKAMALEFVFLTEATTTSPDSIYGCVKSAIFVRFVVIAMSPTAASNFCKKTKTYVLRFPFQMDNVFFPENCC